MMLDFCVGVIGVGESLHCALSMMTGLRLVTLITQLHDGTEKKGSNTNF